MSAADPQMHASSGGEPNGGGPQGGGLKAKAAERWARLRERWNWLDHVVRAWGAYKAHHGDLFAAAVTFFSFLSLFPLILLGVSVAGFVLHSRPDLQRRLFNSIADNVPGSFGDTLHDMINSAISSRAGVGVISLVTLFVTGLGWIANLRAAVEGVWGQQPAKRSFLRAKLGDLSLLAGLGLGAILSVGLTVVGSALSSHVLDWLDLDHVAGLSVLTRLIGLALALGGDLIIFGWLLVRLPRADVPFRLGLRAAVLAAVGFEALKLIGTYYIARVTHSPTAGIFGSVIGILVWLNLVSRYLLFCVAWTATADPLRVDHAVVPDVPADGSGPSGPARRSGATPDAEPGERVSPAATAAVLIGAGAAAGAGATLAARRWGSGRAG
jgi:membrane protein